MKRFKYIRTTWPLLGFLAITLFAYSKAIFSDFVSLSNAGDAYYCFYSWGHYFIGAVKQGTFPLWNSLNLCGHPFGTEAPSNFNILNLFNTFLDPNPAWNIRSMLCMFLAGYFMFLLARSYRLSRFSAFVSGLVFMFSDNVIDGHLHTVSFIIPLILLALDKAVSRKSLRWLSLAGILMTIYYLNSNPQFVVYVFIFCLAYMVFKYCSLEQRYRVKELLLIIGMFMLLSFGLSSLQIFRTLEISGDSQRQALQVRYFQLLPTHLITAIFPYFYDSPFRPDELNFFFGRIWQELVKKAPPLFGYPYLTSIYYLGIIPLILGIPAFLKRPRGSVEGFFSFSIIAVILYMSTTFLSHIFIRHIPILSQMFQTHRTFIIYEVSIAVLAGWGAELLLVRDRSAWQAAMRRINKIILLGVIIIGSVLSAIHIFLVWNRDFLLKTGKELVDKYVIASSHYTHPAEMYYLRVEQIYGMFSSWSNIFGPSLYISFIIIFTCLLLLYLYTRGLIKKRLFKTVLILVILGDLFIIKSCQIRFSPGAEIAPNTGATDFLTQQPGVFRVMALQDVPDPLKPMSPRIFLKPGSNLFYGLSSPEGLQSIIMARYVDLYRILEKGTEHEFTGYIGNLQDFHPHIANLMNIKYVVTSRDRILKPPFKLVYSDKEYRIYENLAVIPRAFIIHKSLILNKDEEILTALRNKQVSLDKVVVLEESPAKSLSLPGPGYSLDSKAVIKEYQPHSIIIDADMKADGYLVLSDCYFPGWEVYLDDKPDKIYRADYVFRAVALPEGGHKVHFVYRPFSVKLGLFFNLITVLLIAGIFLKEGRRKTK